MPAFMAAPVPRRLRLTDRRNFDHVCPINTYGLTTKSQLESIKKPFLYGRCKRVWHAVSLCRQWTVAVARTRRDAIRFRALAVVRLR
jgi:hypothetical protein